MIFPPSTIGVFGGGQLGRMLGLAARRMGYGFRVFDPVVGCPAGQVADLEVNARYTDLEALRNFAAGCEVVTFEFENIPAAVLEELGGVAPVLPDWRVLHTCQNREREKAFLSGCGYPCAPYAVVDSEAALRDALGKIGLPAVLKTADFGYDGKGQTKLRAGDDPAAAWARLGAPRGVLEGWVDFACELSVVCARTRNGEVRAFPVVENIHTDHILEFSIVPARVEAGVQAEAVELAASIASDLKLVGLMAVEMFLGRDGKLKVNELAPRTHNSGHYTLDACATSQFEQQLRAVCGLPLGAVELLSPAVMVNLLGNLWAQGEPPWDLVLGHRRAVLHLYGKGEARVGRKMGHFTVLGDSAEAALAEARGLKAALEAHAERK